MVKSVLGVNHRGLTDWLLQRLTAIVMMAYTFFLVIYLVCHPHILFAEWRTLFGYSWMKIASMLCLLSLLYHAWIGMWTVFTDYLKPFVLRLVIQSVVMFSLLACFFWGFYILWGNNL